MDNVQMETDLLAFVVRNLRENVGRWKEIAQASGVPYSTVAKIGQGATDNPRIESVQKLANHFAAQARAAA
jgi:predicted transcriptional regulator